MIIRFLLGNDLSEENKAKVSVIKDIDKTFRVLKGRHISTTEFDHLYDQGIETLANQLFDLQSAVCHKTLEGCD